MYPTFELAELALRKSALRAQIALNREHCVALATEVVRPLALIDRVRAQWQRLSPMVKLAAVPLALLLRRGWARRGAKTGWLRTVWRWIPVAMGVARWAQTRRQAR